MNSTLGQTGHETEIMEDIVFAYDNKGLQPTSGLHGHAFPFIGLLTFTPPDFTD